MSLYLDASAIVSLFVQDAHTARIEQILATAQTDILVSDFAAAEYCAALTRRVRLGTLAAADCEALFLAIDAWPLPRRLDLWPSDAFSAMMFVRKLDAGLRAPDALHLAIAEREGATVVTFDAVMTRAAEMLGIAVAF